MRALFLLLLLVGLSGCERLRNSVNQKVMDCGPEARDWSGLWIKVLDPNGQELSIEEGLEAKPLILDASGRLTQSLEVSSKSCVHMGSSEALVIRSRATDRNWSLIVNRGALPWNQTVHLQDNSRQNLQLNCPVPWISNGQILLPLVGTAETQKEAFAVSTELKGPQGLQLSGSFGLSNQENSERLVLPPNWPDGPAELTLHFRNLFQLDSSSLAVKEQHCPLIIDRKKPILQVSPAPNALGQVQVRPGELVHLRTVDEHPLQLSWCMEAAGSETCQGKWPIDGADISLPAPERGQWTLHGLARDAAGNSSVTFAQTIQVIQMDLINSIAARADQALAEKSTDGFKAADSILRALVDYERLVLPEEQQKIENKLIDSILEIGPSIKEKNRAEALGTGLKLWSLGDEADSPYLVLTDLEVSVWSSSGKLIHSLPIEDAQVADWSSQSQALVVSTSDKLQVFRYRDHRLERAGELTLNDVGIFGYPRSIKWFEDGSRFLIAPALDLLSLFIWQDNSIQLQQRFDLKDVKNIAISAGDKYIAATTYGSDTGIWEARGQDWEQIVNEERSNEDMKFIDNGSQGPAELLLLTWYGVLMNWQPGQDFKEVSPEVQGEHPSESSGFNRMHSLQTWADGKGGLIERGGRFYQWKSGLDKTLQSVTLNGFAWERLQQWKIDRCRRGVWMQDDRTVSYWEWRENSYPDPSRLVKVDEWVVAPGDPEDFINNCRSDDRQFLTVESGDGRLRLWSQNGPLPQVNVEKSGVTFARFFPGFPEGERLVLSGFDTLIHIFTKFGEKIQELKGHKQQVNEVRYLADSDQWLSTGEDSTSRLWNIQGDQLASLSLEGIKGTSYRDSTVLLGSDHILSAGTGFLGVWQRQTDQSWVLQNKIPVPYYERSKADSLRVLQNKSQSRFFVWLGGRGVVRGLFISPNGEVLPNEPGLPELTGLDFLQVSPNGQRMALRTSKASPLAIFRQDDTGWREEPILQDFPQPSSPWLLSWSPDALAFVLVFDKKLEFWSLQNASWQKQAEKTLIPGSRIERGILWSGDGKRLIYSNQGEIHILDRNLQVEHRVKAFPTEGALETLAVSSDPLYLAAGQDRRVRLLDFHLAPLREKLCTWLKDYLEAGDAPSDLEKIQELCRK